MIKPITLDTLGDQISTKFTQNFSRIYDYT